MRHITGKQLGIIASVIWLVVAPTIFHLSREDSDKHSAGDRYQLCIKQFGLTKGGIERCNRNLRQALFISHWSSWAQVAFIPPVLGWLTAWGLSFIVRRRRSKPEPGSEQTMQIAEVESANSDENYFRHPGLLRQWQTASRWWTLTVNRLPMSISVRMRPTRQTLRC